MFRKKFKNNVLNIGRGYIFNGQEKKIKKRRVGRQCNQCMFSVKFFYKKKYIEEEMCTRCD